MKTKITATVDEMVEYKKQGLSNAKIGEIFDCSKTTVNNYFKIIGFNYKTFEAKMTQKDWELRQDEIAAKKRNTAKKNIPVEEIIRLHKEGLYDREIAERLGCGRSLITTRLNQYGYTDRKSKIEDITLRNQISQSLRGKMVGELNPNYKGYTNERQIARGIFKTLSKEMILNSGFHCHICGKKSREYHTHHIKPFSIIFYEFIENAYSGNIETIYDELTHYPDFMDKNNLIVVCPECHKQIHYTDNPELNPYRWGSATTIENIEEEEFLEEVSRVESSDSKCEDTE